MGDTIITSLNTRGLREQQSRKELFYWLTQQNTDITCLQETHSTIEDETTWKLQTNGEIYFSHGTSQSRGTCIIVNKKHIDNVKPVYTDDDGRVCIVQFSKNDKTFLIVNIYAPNVDDPTFFENVLNIINENEVKEIIICGDFNLVLNPDLDRTDCNRYKPRAYEVLKKAIEEIELVDLWRCVNPEKVFYTWSRSTSTTGGKTFSASRIDYALMTQGLANCTECIKYCPGYKTDHALIHIKISTTAERRGPGYWKFNSKLLHQKTFVNKCNEILECAPRKYAARNPADIWENCKKDVIKYAKMYSKSLACERKREFSNLQSKLSEANESLHEVNAKAGFKANSTVRKNVLLHKAAIEQRLEELISKQTQSAAFRSRCKFVKDGEKNTRYFYSLEKRNFNKKTMSYIENSDGKIVSSSTDILEEQKKFYTKLYTSDRSVEFGLKNDSASFISETEKCEMDSDISLEEFTNAIKTMPRDKTPGLGGLNTEFYQFFWSKIKLMYRDAILYAKKIGRLHLSARRGVITLIPKRDKNPIYLKSWRPLTMLGICYKILAKVLANRLKKILPGIISDEQTAYIEGRQISLTIRTTLDILKRKDISGYILLLDFEKCFDRIEYTAIRGALRYFNIGTSYIEWVSLLLDNFTSCTTNNGLLSEFFSIERSCHQGCPLAPYLFLVCGEVLNHKIKESSTVNGITIGELQHIIAQFADDTQLFLDTKESVEGAIQVLDTIQGHIGLKINFEKSCIYAIGGAPVFSCSKPLVWDPGIMQILGINAERTADTSYLNILVKAENILKLWHHRSLTLIGKVLIVNTLIASLFVYTMQVLEDPSDQFYIKFDKIIHNFLWKGKKAKISTGLLKNSIENGGLKLCDLKTKNQSLKLAWIFRNEDHVVNSMQALMPETLGILFWECTLNEHDARSYSVKLAKANTFWKTILLHWFRFTWQKYHKEIRTEEQVKDQVIWYNTYIKIGNELVSNHEAITKGMIYIGDLLNEDGTAFLDYAAVKDKYDLSVTWLWYRSLCNAIPKKWRNILNYNSECDSIDSLEISYVSIREVILNLDSQKRRPKMIYDLIIQTDKHELDRYYDLFNAKVDVDFDTYKNAFVQLRKLTDNVKYRDFQYRLLTNAIHANDKLFHWKKVSSQKCEYCTEIKQNPTHLLYTCPGIQPIWKKLEMYASCMDMVEKVNFTLHNVMLNLIHDDPQHICNFMVLVTKQYIYYCKCAAKKTKFL